MKLFKPYFWKKKYSIFSILLLPISILIQILFFIKKIIVKKESFSVPVICIGNIYIGGTGKTPTAIKMVSIFEKLKKAPVIIKKFYNNQNDELVLIKEKTKNFVVGLTRSEAINKALKKNFNLIILDDGFQDYTIRKNLNILCFNSNQLIGNGFSIPSGPLREPISSIKNSQIIIINGNRNENFEKRIKKISNDISIYYSNYLPVNIKKLQNINLLAFAGIGNPENFFQLLSKYNLKVEKTISFPDHYNYTEKDIKNLFNLAKKNSLRLVTTEKDYCRLKYLKLNENISHIAVQLNLVEEEKFIKELKNYIK
tara:strand:+ start:3938 stop:4873 length:936 start_codon:yes stop_codon:yes gene_type:complete